MDEVFKFFGKKKEGRELSNFWEGEVEVDGRVYSNGELAFHGSKYVVVGRKVSGERSVELIEYGKKFEKEIGEWGGLSGGEAKKKGGKKGLCLTGNELKIWDVESLDIQRKICDSKLEKHKVVRDVLKSTGKKILVHPGLRMSLDKVKKCKWEGKEVVEEGKTKIVGGNMLGNIWMEKRDML